MTNYLCPVCIAITTTGDPEFDIRHETVYNSISLREHIRNHDIVDLVRFVVDEAEDPDNSYMKHEKGCQCPAHEDHSWLK